MSPGSNALSLGVLAVLLLFALRADAAPVCAAWGASTPQGKKEKTIDGVKHTCDASNRSRSCCEYGQQSKCWNETQTTYENCTPARTAPGPGKLQPKDLPTLKQEGTTPKPLPKALPKGNMQEAK